jgi:hypothetical protein
VYLPSNMMQTLLTSEIYGVVSRNKPRAWLLLLTSRLGSGIGPALVGLLEDTTANYTVPFTVTSLLAHPAACILLARPPHRSLPHASEAAPPLETPWP